MSTKHVQWQPIWKHVGLTCLACCVPYSCTIHRLLRTSVDLKWLKPTDAHVWSITTLVYTVRIPSPIYQWPRLITQHPPPFSEIFRLAIHDKVLPKWNGMYGNISIFWQIPEIFPWKVKADLFGRWYEQYNVIYFVLLFVVSDCYNTKLWETKLIGSYKRGNIM